ncbi:hypothetical protein Tco_0648762 [Tanacetum coccineum]
MTFAVMCKAYGGEPSVDLLRSFLNLGRAGDWLTLSSRGGTDVPKALTKPVTHLENWKGLKTSWKYSPKKPVIYHHGHAPPPAPPPSIHKEGARCWFRDAAHHLIGKLQKVLAQASKVAGDASTPLDVDSNLDIHGKPDPSTICTKELKDTAYMRQTVLGNFLNGRTQELISALHKARASCDTIQEREIKKDKVYAELEKKCNEAFQDLDKNPLVSDMRAELETLQSRVNGLFLFKMDSLRQDRAAVVARVILDAAIKLIRSDEMGVLIARLVKASIIHGRCVAFEEVSELKKPFVLEEMPGYRPSSKEEYD